MGDGPVGPTPEQGCSIVDHFHWNDGNKPFYQPPDISFDNDDIGNKWIGPSSGSLYLRETPASGYVQVLCARKTNQATPGDRSIFWTENAWKPFTYISGAVDRPADYNVPHPSDPD